MPIPGGYILMARKILESELMDKPALYHKLWTWMLLRAEWRADGKLKRGQFHTSIDEMRDAMSWRVGYRIHRPTIKEIRCAYEWFAGRDHEGPSEGQAKGTMIGITRGTRGMLVTILNYEEYQNPKNYEGHNEGHNESPAKGKQRAHDSKEVEEGRMNNTPHTPRKRGSRVKGEISYSESFEAFWAIYPKPVGKEYAYQCWQRIKDKHPAVKVPQIMAALKAQIEARHFHNTQGEYFPPNPSTWINQARWDDALKASAPQGGGMGIAELLARRGQQQ